MEWRGELLLKGLEINTSNSKVIQIGRNYEKLDTACNGVSMECVESYQYLGTLISRDGRIGQEMSNRVNKASRVFYQISNNNQNNKNKLMYVTANLC